MQPLISLLHPDPDVLQQARQLGLPPIAAQVLANRATRAGVTPDWLLDDSVHSLDPPDGLPDIELAAERIARAVMGREHIALATDADSDGVNACTVLIRALTGHFGHPADRVHPFIGLKLSEGYGLSDSVCTRILSHSPQPTLVITADIGSSDGPRIERLAAAGLDTVVTDHHGIPVDGGPRQALAFVNPQRPDSRYPDPLIAGVMVAWLVLWATRRRLIDCGHLPARPPSLGSLLGWVATGTVADVVSLARSRNNRIVVNAGLPQIAAGEYPCWRALRSSLGDPAKPLSSADLAFGIGPRLNAAGRLHDAMAGVQFLLSATDAEATQGAALLNRTNNQRREIEKRLTAEALVQAEAAVAAGQRALTVALADGHAGVHGIVASRLVQNFARPAVCFSSHQEQPGVLTGSCRSIDGLHMLEVLQTIAAQDSSLFLRFGGHAGAAGLSIMGERLDEFTQRFQLEAERRLRGQQLQPRLWVDADVVAEQVDLALVNALAQLGPYGREFSEPLLRGRFDVLTVREMGQDGGHWRLQLAGERRRLEAIWFNAGRRCPVQPGQTARLVFTPELNWWRGESRLQLRVLAVDTGMELG